MGELHSICSHTSVALVVLDLFMPGLTGWAVAQRIQTLRPAAGILVLTGLNGTDAEHERWQAAGITYLRKTSAPEEVLRAVAIALVAVRIAV